MAGVRMNVWAACVVAMAPAAFMGCTGIGVRYTIAADHHGDAEGEQDAEWVHLEHREVGDDEGDERAEITERAGDLHAVEAVPRLNDDSVRCHAVSRRPLGHQEVYYADFGSRCHCPACRRCNGPRPPAQTCAVCRHAEPRCEGTDRATGCRSSRRAWDGYGATRRVERVPWTIARP